MFKMASSSNRHVGINHPFPPYSKLKRPYSKLMLPYSKLRRPCPAEVFNMGAEVWNMVSYVWQFGNRFLLISLVLSNSEKKDQVFIDYNAKAHKLKHTCFNTELAL